LPRTKGVMGRNGPGAWCVYPDRTSANRVWMPAGSRSSGSSRAGIVYCHTTWSERQLMLVKLPTRPETMSAGRPHHSSLALPGCHAACCSPVPHGPPLRRTHPFGRAQQARANQLVKKGYLSDLLFGRPTATLAMCWMVGTPPADRPVRRGPPASRVPPSDRAAGVVPTNSFAHYRPNAWLRTGYRSR